MTDRPPADPATWMREEGDGESLVDRIADTLATDIVAGRIEPGERIRHQELTSRFNVSFGPVREALLKLEQERLVQILPRRGARVVELGLEQVEDLLSVRCAIYPVLARAAAMRGTDKQLRAFHDQVEELARVLLADASPDDIAVAAYWAGARLADAGANNWARSISRTTVRQPNWAFGPRASETVAERKEAARRWRHLAKTVLTRDADAAAQAAHTMALRSALTVLPKLYKEEGLSPEEIERRLQLLPRGVS